MSYIFSFLNWFFGVLALIFCIVSMTQLGGLLSGLAMLFISFLLIPPIKVATADFLKITFKPSIKFLLIFILFILFVVFFPSSPDSNVPESTPVPVQEDSKPEMAKETIHKIGDEVTVGYMSYKVTGIEWKHSVGPESFGAKADARYLLVKITVKNNDTKARQVEDLKIYDENGSEYESSSDSIYLGDKNFFLQSLNPSVKKSGILLYDVPPNHHYKLKATGGYFSSEEVEVQLN